MNVKAGYGKNHKPVYYYKNKRANNREIQSLIKDLHSSEGLIRQDAREKLVEMGPKVVEYLKDLTHHHDAIVRWEAVKTLSQIADPGSIPILIDALYDKDEDVRWVAGEGLIAIGTPVVKPLLDELIRNSESFFLRKGAHHFFTGSHDYRNHPEIFDLISALDGPDAKIHTPAAAKMVQQALSRKNMRAS
jgi:HEAT repeat protein